MKLNLRSSKSSIIAILLSIAFILFMVTYPSCKTQAVMDEIISYSEQAIKALGSKDLTIASSAVNNMRKALDNSMSAIKFFHSHEDVAELDNAVSRAERLIKMPSSEPTLILMCLCDVIESSEHLIGKNGTDLSDFI